MSTKTLEELIENANSELARAIEQGDASAIEACESWLDDLYNEEVTD